MVSASVGPWHHLVVYFVLLAAAIAILIGVVVVAMGRGGEIAQSHRDARTVPPRINSAADLALLRLPIGLLGYSEQATDEALDAATRLIADQETEIARLRQEVWRLRSQPDAEARVDVPTSEFAEEFGSGAAKPAAAGADGETQPSPDPVGGQLWQQP